MEFVYLVSSRVQVAENSRVYQLAPKDLIPHNPMGFHHIKSLDGTSPHVINLFFCIRSQLAILLYPFLQKALWDDPLRIPPQQRILS